MIEDRTEEQRVEKQNAADRVIFTQAGKDLGRLADSVGYAARDISLNLQESTSASDAAFDANVQSTSVALSQANIEGELRDALLWINSHRTDSSELLTYKTELLEMAQERRTKREQSDAAEFSAWFIIAIIVSVSLIASVVLFAYHAGLP